MIDDNVLRLDFLKRVLIGSVGLQVQSEFWRTKRWPLPSLMKYLISQPIPYELEYGKNWPENGHTMIGLKRLDNLHESLDWINLNNIEGDLLEAGVWRGGACIFMKMYCKLYNLKKKVYVCDSFEGIPEVDTAKCPQDTGLESWSGIVAVSKEAVKDTFRLYDALDENIVFIPGWFRDSLPNVPVNKLSLLRLDGDLYSSTMDILIPLYPKVVENGIVIVDDYGAVKQCANAIMDYLNKNHISVDMQKIDDSGIYWRKR